MRQDSLRAHTLVAIISVGLVVASGVASGASNRVPLVAVPVALLAAASVPLLAERAWSRNSE